MKETTRASDETGDPAPTTPTEQAPHKSMWVVVVLGVAWAAWIVFLMMLAFQRSPV
jgi:hypothetical protein